MPEQPTIPGIDPDDEALAARFEQFHQDNPHVYTILVRLAREWIRRTGRHKVGIAILWERMRWELAVETSEEAPALNNDYKAFFARLMMRDEPDLAELFDLRRSVADEWLERAA